MFAKIKRLASVAIKIRAGTCRRNGASTMSHPLLYYVNYVHFTLSVIIVMLAEFMTIQYRPEFGSVLNG
jgi:hypothetical protein